MVSKTIRLTPHPNRLECNKLFPSLVHLPFLSEAPGLPPTPDGGSRTRECPYDWVIFLGGTNDLAYSIAPTKIYDEIVAITNLPLATGARVLLMTVPECGAKSEKLNQRRDTLNELLKGDGREGV